MTTCAECQNALIDYVDGHASDGDRNRLDAHLAHCSACRGQLALERRLSGLLHRTLAAAPSEQRLVWPRPAAPRAPSGRRRGALVAAAVAVVAVVAFGLRPSPAPPLKTIASHAEAATAARADERAFADLRADIEREASAAQLAMSAKLLAGEPAAERYAEEARRFVADAFPETKAGREAAQRGWRLKERHSNRAHPPVGHANVNSRRE